MSQNYQDYHGYVSGVICLLGIFGNICSISIWSRAHLRTSANIILSALAVADLMTVSFYIVYAIYLYIATRPTELDNHSESGMYLVLICFHEYIISSSLSSWMTISLAIFRYLKVCKPLISRRYCTIKRSKITVWLVFILGTLYSSPFYLYYEVYDLSETDSNTTGHWLRLTAFAESHTVSYQLVILWLYGIVMKIVPCIALIILSALMIRSLRRAGVPDNDSRPQRDRNTGYNKTTIMLITIVLLYVTTALPIGIAAFVSAVRGDSIHFFYFLSYSSVGNLLNLCPNTNATVNCFVYFTMSKQYRNNFLNFFFRKKGSEVHLDKNISHDMNSTNEVNRNKIVKSDVINNNLNVIFTTKL